MLTRYLVLIGLWASGPLCAQSTSSFNRPEQPGQLAITISGAGTNYLGDLNGRRPARRTDVGGGFSGGLTYRLTDRLSVRSELHLYQLRGSQRGTAQATNNLSFQSYNPELTGGVVFDLIPASAKATLVPYLTAGAGLTYLNPKTRYENRWTSLAPLRTEGVKYRQTAALAYGGIGLAVRLPGRLAVGVEVTYRLPSSDYLDDVSTTYPTATVLTSAAAIALSDRRPELGLPRHTPGDRRGFAAGTDTYLTGALRISYRLLTARERQDRRAVRCRP